MSSGVDVLDDSNETCVYIPPGEPEQEGSTFDDAESPFDWRDLPDGYELRMQVYRAAWDKCLNRVQSIVQALHAPIAEEVVVQTTTAYTNVLPGLPYPELPVIAIYADPGSFSLYTDIMQRLHDQAAANGESHQRLSFQTHLYPADCPNLTAMMKAIVSGFLDDTDASHPKRRPTTSLASYDINTLAAWYNAQEHSVNLLVFLHDFEQFDPAIIQDVFYICSLHIPKVPLVFLLALSSPPSPSYLHTTYSRATLALLRIDSVSAPSGPSVIEEILAKTFFDPSFEPDVMLGPGTLDFLHDWTTRQSASLDGLYTILQLAHMKHFDEPLTLLVRPSPLPAALRAHTALPFLASLHVRLQPHTLLPDLDGAQPPNLDGLAAAVCAAHAAFRDRARGVRVALGMMRIARHGALGEVRRGERCGAGLELFGAALRGHAARDARYLGAAVKKLPASKLRALLSALYAFLDALADPAARRAEEAARVRIVSALTQLPQDADDAGAGAEDTGARSEAAMQLAAGVGDWLAQFLEERLVRLDEGALWDVWYTGATPFPSELINPAPRATIISALLHPHAFAAAGESAGEEEDEGHADVPDTSVLFRRYMEAGRMVNVYDWFEAFALELEGRRRTKGKGRAGAAVREAGRDDAEGPGNRDGDGDGNEDEDEEAAERWREEVQARFIRALHELDFMGFVKHTGRKADHVIRTIYDLAD